VLALLVVLFEFIMAPVAVLPSPDASPATPPAAAVAPAPGQAPVPVVTPAPPVAAPEAASPAITAADASAPAAAETVAAGPEPKSAARAGEAELHFVFETQSWVEVRDRDDRILFSQLNPAGAVQHLQAKPPLNVVVGNARGVRLTYNGRPFDLAPHTRVEVARFTLE
jgi:cytoskeleton protein RodZ